MGNTWLRRVLAILFASLLVLGASACSDDDNSDDDTEESDSGSDEGTDTQDDGATDTELTTSTAAP